MEQEGTPAETLAETLPERRWRWLSAAMPYVFDSLVQRETDVFFPSRDVCEYTSFFVDHLDENFVIDFTELFGEALSMPRNVFVFFMQRPDLVPLFLNVFVDFLKYAGYFQDLEKIALRGSLENTDFVFLDDAYYEQLVCIVAVFTKIESVVASNTFP
jgi:hypothetical protein